LVRIGYWRSEASDGLPDPADWIDVTMSDEERWAVADYLDGGFVTSSECGWSNCRICGRMNGHREVSDGSYVWPQGLSHYVRDHWVRLPSEVVAHATRRLADIRSSSVDDSWWRSQRQELTGSATAEDGRRGPPRVAPQEVGLMWDYGAFPVWWVESGVEVEPDWLRISDSLRDDLQAWSDRLTALMGGERELDTSRGHRLPLSADVVDGVNAEAEALAVRLRAELPAGFTVLVRREVADT
jgi:hypothetical protein